MSTKFQAGKSGNPNGRPPGVEDKRVALRKLLAPHAKDLVAKAVDMAKGGDVQALRLCLERIIPPYKADGAMVSLPALKDAQTATEQAREALRAMADSEISVLDAGAILAAIAQQARITEFDELEQRIRKLEQLRARST